MPHFFIDKAVVSDKYLILSDLSIYFLIVWDDFQIKCWSYSFLLNSCSDKPFQIQKNCSDQKFQENFSCSFKKWLEKGLSQENHFYSIS